MSLLLASSGDIANGVVEADGVDFDGVKDYLSRSSDLTGNVDSKTFTFSCWVYLPDTTSLRIYSATNGTSADTFIAVSSGNLIIYALDSSGTARLYASGIPIPTNTFVHILFSCDLSNTSKRFVYINDTLVSPTYNTYLNYSINFTSSAHCICANAYDFSSKLKGRLSNLFLSHQYMDLSIVENRRIFISSDGKPTPTATLSALNPILYLPLKDSATATQNLGTGGNFTLNGTIATSNRGANQDNCVASKFDGVNDYLSRTSLAGVIDSQYITFSCIYNKSSTESSSIVYFENGTQDTKIEFNSDSIRFQATAAGGTNYIFSIDLISTAYFVYGKSYNISFSYGGVGTYKIIINGIDVSSQAHVNVDNGGAIGISGLCYIARANSVYFNGNIGELYFDTKYIDLATNNPFWIED